MGKAITLRNIPKDVEGVIRRRAKESRSSLNRAVIELLQEGAGLGKAEHQLRQHDLDFMFGAWSEDEARAFEETLRHQRRIDAELWR